MIVDLIIIAIIVLFGIFGLKKGFMQTLLSFAGVLLALILSLLFADNLAEALIASPFGKTISNLANNILSGMGGFMTTVVPSYEALVQTLSESLPNIIAEALAHSIDGFTGTVANMTVAEILTPGLTNIMMTIISFILIFVGSLIVFSIVKAVVKSITSLPIINSVDKALGFVLGVVKGVIFIYVVFLFVSLLSGAEFMQWFVDALNSSKLALWLYNNNLILIVGKGLLDGTFTLISTLQSIKY